MCLVPRMPACVLLLYCCRLLWPQNSSQFYFVICPVCQVRQRDQRSFFTFIFFAKFFRFSLIV
jgi:hypothetical protein